MNINTGRIQFYEPERVTQDGALIELGNLPDPLCPVCKGKGRVGPKILGNKHRRRFIYLPCPCTNPKVK